MFAKEKMIPTFLRLARGNTQNDISLRMKTFNRSFYLAVMIDGRRRAVQASEAPGTDSYWKVARYAWFLAADVAPAVMRPMQLLPLLTAGAHRPRPLPLPPRRERAPKFVCRRNPRTPAPTSAPPRQRDHPVQPHRNDDGMNSGTSSKINTLEYAGA